MTQNYNEARTGNFGFVLGKQRRMTFAVQQANVGDITLGQAPFPTGQKDIMIPSNKLEFEPLNVQFIVSEDHFEWLYMYKWLLKMKNQEDSIHKFSDNCELLTYDALGNPSTSFTFTINYPYMVSGMDFSFIGDSQVITCQASFWYNDFFVTTKDGEKIGYDWNGEL